MRQEKDLLVVLSIFGQHMNEVQQVASYIKTLEGIYSQIENSPEHSFRVVVSACMVGEKCTSLIKEKFGDKIHIFKYPDRYSCQVTANKTILKSIEHFNEEYEGYLYISSGIFFGDDPAGVHPMFFVTNRDGSETQVDIRVGNPQILGNVVKKLKTQKYGIVQLQVDDDHGYHFIGHGPSAWATRINFMYDYAIPMGNHANFHAAAIHKSLKDFYGKPISDVHGFCGMESTLSYCCAALRKQYLLLGDSCLRHRQKFDNDFSAPGRMLNTAGVPLIGAFGNPCGDLFWGRKKEAIAIDPDAMRTGLGYYPGPAACNIADWNGVWLVHNIEKYDNDYLALDEDLKDVVKRLFFTNNDEINYEHVFCEII